MKGDFTLKLEKFSGLHTTSDASLELLDSESPEMMNFKVTDGGKLKRRDGFSKICPLSSLRGLYCGKLNGKTVFLAVGQKTLYASFSGFDSLSSVAGEVPGEDKVEFFPFYGAIYLLTGKGILKYDGESLSALDPYVPTLMIGTTPKGSGVTYEEVNLLTPFFKQRFSPTGTDKHFYPVIQNLTDVVWVKENGKLLREDVYYWNRDFGALTILEVPEEGIDTIEAMFEVAREGTESDRILNCRNAVSFGGANDTRAFLYGNVETPGMRYHSGVVDGKPCFEYFPETAFSLVGSGEDITAVLRHYDRLLIWTENGAYYSYLEYMTGVDGRLVAAFPILPLSDRNGCCARGQAVLMENDPCTVDHGGLLRWVSTNIRDERNAVLFSDPIAQALRREDPSRAILFNRKTTSELYLCFDTRIFVYHYGMKRFYYYELPLPVRFLCEDEKEMFFGTDDGIFRVGGDTDDGAQVSARWTSKKLNFGDGGKEKNLFRLSLSAKAQAPVHFDLTLKGDEKEAITKRFSFFGNGEVERKSLRFFQRRFRYLECSVSCDGKSPILITGLEFYGRKTDRNV